MTVLASATGVGYALGRASPGNWPTPTATPRRSPSPSPQPSSRSCSPARSSAAWLGPLPRRLRSSPTQLPSRSAPWHPASRDLLPFWTRRRTVTLATAGYVPPPRHQGAPMTSEQHGANGQDALLTAMMNLTKFHREHEKFYASSPREFAVTLQRHARTMQALADQWSTAEPSTRHRAEPLRGRRGPQRPAAVQLDGVLFLEGRAARPRSPTSSATCGTPPRTSGHRRVVGHGHGVLLGHGRDARRDRRPGRHARRTPPHHRQRLAGGHHEHADRATSSTAPPTCSSTSTSVPPRCAPTWPAAGSRAGLLYSAAR